MMFMSPVLLCLAATSMLVAAISAQQGADHLDAAPATVYENTVLSPQNM
jgi:hypothetical protein